MSESSIARRMRPNRHSIDEDSASRLLQGLVHPDDAPPGYAAVAGLLNSAAHLSLGPVNDDAAATTISAMVEVIRDATPAPRRSQRKALLGRLLAGKALAAVAVLGLTATGAAAAKGSLPDAVQGVVSDAVSHIGVDIPHPNHGKSAAHRQDGTHKPSGVDQGGPGEDSGESGSGTSDFVHENKGITEGPFGQVVCVEASDDQCHSGDTNSGQGGGDDTSTPSGTTGSNDNPAGSQDPGSSDPGGSQDQGSDAPAGSQDPGGQDQGGDAPGGSQDPGSDAPGEDGIRGKPEVTPRTTPTTGSIETGAAKSGRDVGRSGQGKSGNGQ